MTDKIRREIRRLLRALIRDMRKTGGSGRLIKAIKRRLEEGW